MTAAKPPLQISHFHSSQSAVQYFPRTCSIIQNKSRAEIWSHMEDPYDRHTSSSVSKFPGLGPDLSHEFLVFYICICISVHAHVQFTTIYSCLGIWSHTRAVTISYIPGTGCTLSMGKEKNRKKSVTSTGTSGANRGYHSYK